MTQPLLNFPGPDQSAADRYRLTCQFGAIFALMKDGKWRTLKEIEEATGYPQSSISAQLRHCRKAEFGGHTMNRKGLGG